MNYEIFSSYHRTPLIGAYLPPSTLAHLPNLEEALKCFPEMDPVFLGDLNADIVRLNNPRDKQFADLLASLGLVDLMGHFHQRLHYCHLKTWWQF